MSSTAMDVNDVFDDDEGGLSGFTILAILATLLMVFVLVVYYAYRQGKASAISATENLPVVAADPSPVAEDVPTSVARDDGRSEAFDRINGTIDTRIVTDESPSRDALDGYSGAPSQMAQRENTTSEPDPLVAAMARAEELDTAPSRTSTPDARTVAAPSQKPSTATTPPAQTPVRVSTSTTPSSSATSATSGSHVVQVGAFPSTNDAFGYFETLSTRMGALVTAKRPDVQVADVNGRTYHRLRIGPFTSKGEATNYCAQLKSRGQDCLVRGL